MNTGKIWLLLDSSKGGGIESHVLQLSQGLLTHGEHVEVIFLTDYGAHPLRDALLSLGIATRSLDGQFKTLFQLLKNERPMVLHTHGYKAGIIGRFAAWLNKTPTVSTYHAGEIATGKLAIYDWIDRKTARFSHKVFAVSPQIANRLPGQVDLFNNFVNSDNLKESTGEQIAFVGRVSREKGPDYFMALASYYPEIDFHLYGDGPEMDEIKSESPSNLKLHGQQDDMSDTWSKIGLLVIPSRFEGLPMAALEAMARGIPVLAFNVGALDRLIKPECNGWLVEPGNIHQLAKQISLWSGFSAQHKSLLKLACKKTIKAQFCSRRAIPRLIENYKQVARIC